MIKFLFIVIILMKLFFLSSCGTVEKKSEIPLSASQLRYENDEQALTEWQKLLEKKEFLKVNNEIFKSLNELSFSKHWYGIMFTYALAKEGLEDWSGALQVYQSIIGRSTDQQWEFVALALHRKAYCYEVTLENEKALAALTDASRLKSYLPLEVTLAEIPARLASVYARMDQISLADQFTKKAELGIQQLRAMKRNNDSEVVVRTLYKMGGLSLTQIDESSFKQNILTLIRNQRFLIQAIEHSQNRWARESEKDLLRAYSNLWSFIESYKVTPSSDWQMDWVLEGEKRAEFISLYLEAIEKLKNFEAPPETSDFIKTATVYNQIKNIENRALAMLNQELLKKPWDIPIGRMPSSEGVQESYIRNQEKNDFNSIDQQKKNLMLEENWELGSSGLPKKKMK